VDDQNQAVYQEIHANNNMISMRGLVQIGGDVLPIIYGDSRVQPEAHDHFSISDANLLTIFQYPSSENPGIKIGQ
jgi:hypothetical protein